MASPVLMPKAGQSMTEGKIVAWLKKEGDAVKRGDPLLEIETDKANLEVEALDAGVLRKVFNAAGDVVPVLSVIGVIGGATEAIDFDAVRAAGAAEESPAPDAKAEPSPPPKPALARQAQMVSAPRPEPAHASPERVFASPLARRVAHERGVHIEQLRGSGPGGRVLRRDVDDAPAAQRRSAGVDGAAPAFALAPSAKPYPPASPRPPAKVAVEGMRKAIGTALQQSKQTIPHFYATMSIDMSAALELKRSLDAGGTKVSVNDLVVRACALALTDEPRVNCRVYPDRIEYPSDVNIGVAVGSEEGLVVPVIQKAQDRDLAGIAAESRRVIESANAGKLIGSGQGTFTISNLGMFGVESFTAIINPPEGAILAVGAARTELVPLGGGFFPRPMMKVTLSSDHRAVDGMLAARFLARLKHLLESAERL